MFYNVLAERYDIVISDDPDFIIFTPLTEHYEYANYDRVHIMFTGEPFSADYNSVDYANDFDNYQFGDRHIRYPFYLYKEKGAYQARKKLTEEETGILVSQKNKFCNFIYGHKTVSDRREAILNAVSEYKRVDSIGTYLKNMPEREVAIFGKDGDKKEYVKKYKFTISAESMSQRGFNIEKIMDAFACYSVPIYSGNPDISLDLNAKAFVNPDAFETFEEGVKRIIEIDQNPESAIRRNKYYISRTYNTVNRCLNLHMKKPALHFFYRLYRYFAER